MSNSIYGEPSVAYTAGVKVQQTQGTASKGPERRRVESVPPVQLSPKPSGTDTDEFASDPALAEDPLNELNDLPPRSLLEFWKYATGGEADVEIERGAATVEAEARDTDRSAAAESIDFRV